MMHTCVWHTCVWHDSQSHTHMNLTCWDSSLMHNSAETLDSHAIQESRESLLSQNLRRSSRTQESLSRHAWITCVCDAWLCGVAWLSDETQSSVSTDGGKMRCYTHMSSSVDTCDASQTHECVSWHVECITHTWHAMCMWCSTCVSSRDTPSHTHETHQETHVYVMHDSAQTHNSQIRLGLRSQEAGARHVWACV